LISKIIVGEAYKLWSSFIIHPSPASRYFFPLRSKHSPQLPVLKQSVFFSSCEKPSFTPRQNSGLVYFNF
jgi:hypothetical protein